MGECNCKYAEHTPFIDPASRQNCPSHGWPVECDCWCHSNPPEWEPIHNGDPCNCRLKGE